MFTIAICDDDANICNVIKEYVIKNYDDSRYEFNIQMFHSGDSLLEMLEKKACDINILFLDVEMPGRDGIEVKKILEKDNHVETIVFITSHMEMFRDAFGRKVIGFIDKPFNENTIIRWIDSVYKEYENKKIIDIDSVILRTCEIRYIRSEGNYLICSMDSGNETNALRCTITTALEQLDDTFVRIHRSYVINLKYVDKVKYNSVMIKGDTILPIGRQYSEVAKKAYDEYVIAKVKGRMGWLE